MLKRKFHFSKDSDTKVTKKKIIQKPNDGYCYPNTPKYCNMQIKLARDRQHAFKRHVIQSLEFNFS